MLITSEDEKEPHAQKGSGGSDPETMEDLSESRPTASIQYSPEEAALPAEDEEASSQVIMMYGAHDTHNDTRTTHSTHDSTMADRTQSTDARGRVRPTGRGAPFWCRSCPATWRHSFYGHPCGSSWYARLTRARPGGQRSRAGLSADEGGVRILVGVPAGFRGTGHLWYGQVGAGLSAQRALQL